MASMNTRLNIKKLNMNIVQKHEGSKQVGLKQLDSKQVSNNLVLNKLGSNNLIVVLKQESVEYRMKNMFGLRWNCRELKRIVKLRFFREDSNEAAFAVAAVERIYAHDSLTFNNTIACEAKIWATKGLLSKTKENVLGIKIVKDQSDYTLRVSQSRFYNEKLVQTLLEGHSILSLEGSLSEDCDVEKNGYGLMILGCAGSLKANLQHMEALSTTEAGYMTFTKAWKKKYGQKDF
nr:zinc finger, CCHC-type [Tanacetum cinerariifolium]